MALSLHPTATHHMLVRGSLDINCVPELDRLLEQHQTDSLDLTEVLVLDSAAALTLWGHWNYQLPKDVRLTDNQKTLFEQIAATPEASLLKFPTQRELRAKNRAQRNWMTILIGLLRTFGQLLIDTVYLTMHPSKWPVKEISAACYRSGVTAIPITVIVGFLIGIVLSYLSSLSLRDFGAESFLPMVMGIGILRELGPLLTSIVLAGRSGSAITASLAAMRLTQELDALAVLGVSHSQRLVVPRAIALAVMTPLLVICTNIAALLGGMLAGWVELALTPSAYLFGLRHDVPLADLNIGLFKAVIFGGAIAVISCYFGLSARPNTQSLATHTTRSVVLSISTIILLDAFFAIVFKDID